MTCSALQQDEKARDSKPSKGCAIGAHGSGFVVRDSGDVPAREETDVSDRSRVLMAVVAGAAVGGVAGYLLLTERGRRLRRELEPNLDEIIHEIGRLGGTVGKARSAVNDAWRVLNEIQG